MKLRLMSGQLLINITDISSLIDASTNTNFTSDTDLWHYEGASFEMFDQGYNIYLNVHLTRRWQYYIYTIFIPLYLLLTLQIAGLLIDAKNEGERSGYSITIVLAFQFSLDQVTGTIPQTSQLVLIVVYVNFISILAALIAVYMLISCWLVQNKWWNRQAMQQGPSWKRMPRCLDSLVGILSLLITIVASLILYIEIDNLSFEI